MNMPPPTTVPPRKSGGCVKGCLIAVAVVLIISGIAAYFVVKNIGPMARQFSSATIDKFSDELLKDSKLDPVQKAKLDAVVKGFTAKIRSGEVGLQEGIKVMQSLAEGPILPYIYTASFEAVLLTRAGLSAEELQAGHLTVNRFMHGVVQQRISKDAYEPIFNLFTKQKGADGKERELKQQLTTEEVREVLSRMKAAADAAAVPMTPADIDLAAELQKAIDKGLNS